MGPSRTAQGAAWHRAAHQLLDRPLVFEDPLALRILGHDEERALRAMASDEGRRAAGRAFIVARSRFAEDRLAEAAAHGVRQAVVLGAGLDTFACRNPHRGLRVFELDEAATQRAKRRRLEDVGIAVPNDVVFAPVDLERESVAAALARTSFEVGRPAFVVWLGVTIYLSPETLFATLRGLANDLAAGSEVVFDYAAPPSSLEPEWREAFLAMARKAEAQGEPYRSSFEPGRLESETRAAGFATVVDEGPTALNERYFRGRSDGLYLRGPGHVVRAAT